MSLTNTVCFQLSLGSLSARRKLNPREVCTPEIAASDGAIESLKVSKRILDCEEYAAIVRHAAKTQAWFRGRSIPSLLAPGICLINVNQVAAFEAKAREELPVRAKLVRKLQSRIAEIAAAETAKLGPLGNLADYPSEDRIERALWSRYRFLTFDVPGTLSQVSEAIYQEERQKAATLYEEVLSNATTILRAELLKLVSHMRDITTPNSAGGKRRIFSSALSNLRDFLATLPDRNAIAEDNVVRDLAAQAASIIDGVDTEALRKSEVLRDSVARDMEAVRSNLAAYVQEAPNRQFSFKAT